MPIPRRKPHIKKLRRLARDESLELWSLDECHFQQHGSRCVMWVPPEETDPTLLHAPTRKSVALFGAVSLNDGQPVTQFSANFNAITFWDFLKRRVRYRPQNRRLVLILDNARYHHATMRKPFLTERRRVLSLSFLPPYSPELNPIGRVMTTYQNGAFSGPAIPLQINKMHRSGKCTCTILTINRRIWIALNQRMVALMPAAVDTILHSVSH